MTWFKVDDQATFNPKVVKAGNAAFGAWIRLGSYCNAQLTDGFVTDQIARMVATKRELEIMVEVNLLHVVDGGYQIHDYLEYQKSKEQIQADRQVTRDRVKRHRNANRNAVTPAVTNAVSNTALSDPIRSYPIRSEETQTPDAASPLVLAHPGKPSKFDFASVYDAYPRKEGRTKGIARLRSQVRTPEAFEELKRAVANFVAKCHAEGTEPRFIPHFSTWAGEWRDYVDGPHIVEAKAVRNSLPMSTSVDPSTRAKRLF